MESKESDFIKIMTTILDERSQRIMLGAYANYLGHGGVTALSRETGISRTTITAGQKEAKDIILSPVKYVVQKDGRIRTEGAGRKSVIENHPTIIDELYKLLDGNTVGNPENPLCWTTKSLRNLQKSLNKKGIRVSHPTIGQLLEGMGFSLQQNKKYVESGDAGPDRDTQFRFINDHAKEFMEQGYPVISVDTKKKELIGNYKNNGTCQLFICQSYPLSDVKRLNDKHRNKQLVNCNFFQSKEFHQKALGVLKVIVPKAVNFIPVCIGILLQQITENVPDDFDIFAAF